MGQRYRRLAAVTLACTVVVTGACATDEPPVPDRLTACELLPREDIESVLGGPVDEPATAEAATDTLAGRSGCAWSRSDDSRAALVELVRTADMSASVRRTGFSASARFGAARSQYPEAEPVDLGDRALFVEDEGVLHVLTDGSYLTVEVAAQPTASIRDLAVELGRRAVDRLQRTDRAD